MVGIVCPGPSLGSPVINVSVALHDLKVGGGTSVPMISACVAQGVRQAVAKATPTLLQPIVSLEVIYYSRSLRNVNLVLMIIYIIHECQGPDCEGSVWICILF